ncbi:MAG TPA: SPW repeat protein [Burkholderiales bacterium]|jgi:hypothetical protein
MRRADDETLKRWQDRVVVALGAWLFFSPVALAFWNEIGFRSLDFYCIGAGIAALAYYGLRRRSMWGEWLVFILGLWMVGSPWLLHFTVVRRAAADSVAAGIVIALLSVWVILRYAPDPYQKR